MGNKGSKGPQPEKGGCAIVPLTDAGTAPIGWLWCSNPATSSSESKAAPTKKKGASSNCLKRPAKEQPIGIAPPPLSSAQVVKIHEVAMPALPMAQEPAVADGNAHLACGLPKIPVLADCGGPLRRLGWAVVIALGSMGRPLAIVRQAKPSP